MSQLNSDEFAAVVEKLEALEKTQLKEGFEHDFVTDNLFQCKEFGEKRYFSSKQLAVIDRMYRQKVLGEGRVPQSVIDKVIELGECGKLKPGFQQDFIEGNYEKAQKYGVESYLSQKQIDIINRMYDEVILGTDTRESDRSVESARPAPDGYYPSGRAQRAVRRPLHDDDDTAPLFDPSAPFPDDDDWSGGEEV